MDPLQHHTISCTVIYCIIDIIILILLLPMYGEYFKIENMMSEGVINNNKIQTPNTIYILSDNQSY